MVKRRPISQAKVGCECEVKRTWVTSVRPHRDHRCRMVFHRAEGQHMWHWECQKGRLVYAE